MSDFTLKIDTKTLQQFITASQVAGNDDQAVYNAYGEKVVRFQLYEQDRITPRAIVAGTAFQFSLTKPTDWSLATAPLIRINDDLFTIIDAENGIVEASVSSKSSAFNTYVEGNIDGTLTGITDGAQELVEYLVTNSDSDILNGAINAGVTTFIATDYTKYTVGDKITFLDTPETVIVNAIDSGTSEITFQGAGVDGVSVYSHINGATIDIKTVKETTLFQYPCNFGGRRDLGGQTICSEGGDSPPSFGEVVALIATKLEKLFSFYAEKTTPVDADTMALNDSAASAAPKYLSFANLWVWILSKFQALGQDQDVPENAATAFELGRRDAGRGFDVSAMFTDEVSASEEGASVKMQIFISDDTAVITNKAGLSAIANLNIISGMSATITGVAPDEVINLVITTTAGNALKLNLKATAI